MQHVIEHMKHDCFKGNLFIFIFTKVQNKINLNLMNYLQ